MALIDRKSFPHTLTREDGQPSDTAEHGFVHAIKGEPELTVFGAIGVLALAAGLLVVASYFF